MTPKRGRPKGTTKANAKKIKWPQVRDTPENYAKLKAASGGNFANWARLVLTAEAQRLRGDIQ